MTCGSSGPLTSTHEQSRNGAKRRRFSLPLSFDPMHRVLGFTTTASATPSCGRARAVLFVTGCLVLALGFTLYAVNALPDLNPGTPRG